jgi:hypothetical protein
MANIGKGYKVSKGKDGKVRLKPKTVRLDLCADMKKKNSKRQTWKAAK